MNSQIEYLRNLEFTPTNIHLTSMTTPQRINPSIHPSHQNFSSNSKLFHHNPISSYFYPIMTSLLTFSSYFNFFRHKGQVSFHVISRHCFSISHQLLDLILLGLQHDFWSPLFFLDVILFLFFCAFSSYMCDYRCGRIYYMAHVT